MGSVRRWALLPVLLLVAAMMVAVTMPPASTSAMPACLSPAPMNYACALKPNGQLKYVAMPSRCDPQGKVPAASSTSFT